MSYARWSDDSDVYVFGRDDGWCVWCTRPIEGEADYLEVTPQAAIERLLWLRERGVMVPERALDGLRAEA